LRGILPCPPVRWACPPCLPCLPAGGPAHPAYRQAGGRQALLRMTAVFYCHPERSEGSHGFQHCATIIAVDGIPAFGRRG